MSKLILSLVLGHVQYVQILYGVFFLLHQLERLSFVYILLSDLAAAI